MYVEITNDLVGEGFQVLVAPVGPRLLDPHLTIHFPGHGSRARIMKIASPKNGGNSLAVDLLPRLERDPGLYAGRHSSHKLISGPDLIADIGKDLPAKGNAIPGIGFLFTKTIRKNLLISDVFAGTA